MSRSTFAFQNTNVQSGRVLPGVAAAGHRPALRFQIEAPPEKTLRLPRGPLMFTRMSAILESLQGHERRQFAAGELVIRQGGQTDALYFLIEGAVEILKTKSYKHPTHLSSFMYCVNNPSTRLSTSVVI